MEQENKPAATVSSKPRRWVIAGLATATIAALGATLSWQERAEARGGPMMEGPFGFGGGSSDPAVRAKRIDAMVQWMLADLNATDDQRNKISSILQAAANDLQPLRQQHMQARKAVMQLLAAPTIDRAQLESLRVQQIQLADSASKRMTQAMADAADVLSPDQRTKLVAKWQHHHRGHGTGTQS
jgi:Spy/CpxP family protein refolding chaperone